jgi:signal transduction histidine kinase
MREKGNKRRAHPGLRGQIFAVMAVFVAAVLVILWVFHLFLLKPMYVSIKERELRSTSVTVAEMVGVHNFQEMTDKLARKNDVCISVYEIVGRDAIIRANSHIHGSCIIHNVSSDSLLNRLYTGARKDTYYVERISENFFVSQQTPDVPESIISSRLTTTAGSSYLIVLNAEIEPVGNTTRTLAVQLGIITVILLINAAGFALLLSRHISRPITQMSREAHKLALGSYDVYFDGGSSRETAELGDALNYAARELSAIDAMQKELIANISHDLRTPLTMISGYSEVMRDIPGEMTPENMQIIIDETKHLSDLVNDILDISTMTGGAGKLECRLFSLTDTVRRTMERYNKLRTHDGYSITFLCDRDAYIYADPLRILQVVYNLINNAIHYTGADKVVVIRQITEQGQCRIEVSDTGEGIPAEQLPYIWDRYYKVKNYYKRSVTGTGLGLSIVKNILLLHGAEFGVRSEVGHGSTFWFALPEVMPDEVSAAEEKKQ